MNNRTHIAKDNQNSYNGKHHDCLECDLGNSLINHQ